MLDTSPILDRSIYNYGVSTATRPDRRATSDERREQVLDAAVHEFAVHGLHAARTTAIAERAGISQPYLYALFTDKKSLFLACQDRVREQIRIAFREAGEHRSPAADDGVEGALAHLAASWRALLPNQDLMRCQLQGFAAAADPDIRDNVRQGVMDSIDTVVALTGASRDRVATFVARGLLLNIGATLELPAAYLPAATRQPTTRGAANDLEGGA